MEMPREVDHVTCMNERLLVLLKKKKKKNRENSTRNGKGESPGMRRKEDREACAEVLFTPLLTEQLLLSSGLASP